jgi:rhodanese-related sulfurtransferase
MPIGELVVDDRVPYLAFQTFKRGFADMRSTRWICPLCALLAFGCGKSQPNPIESEKAAVALAGQTAAGGYKLIDTAALSDLVSSRSDMVLLDVRPNADFRAAHILGSTNITFPSEPMDKEWDSQKMDGLSAEQFAVRVSKDPNIRLVVYSGNLACPRGHMAALWARKLGFTNVFRYAAGIDAWRAAGHETRSIKE